ncbi:hypothetical protein O9929_21630 [Vibrio lentus]|nr:hypothetical protein [Vibrio lentus]
MWKRSGHHEINRGVIPTKFSFGFKFNLSSNKTPWLFSAGRMDAPLVTVACLPERVALPRCHHQRFEQRRWSLARH